MKKINKFTICLLFAIIASLSINVSKVYAEEGTEAITVAETPEDNTDSTEQTVTTEAVATEPVATTELSSAAPTVTSTSAKATEAKTIITGKTITTYALKFVGNPYRYGGTSLTKGTDCSGFVMSVYKNFGYKLPHSSSGMRKVGKKVASLSEAKAGDIICYSGHVAIYLGNNKIVHASTKSTGIKISNNAQYKRIITIRRLV